VVLDRDYEISADACDIVLDIVRQNVPFVAVDLPHTWTPWVKRVLLQADEIVLTAVPDLANLRNAKNLIDLLKQNRTNDGPPRLVMNMVKMPKRPEISVKEFSAALDLEPGQVIEFDSETFGLAANNGQMIEEFSGKAKAAQQFRELALALAHRKEQKEDKKKSLVPLGPLLEKLKFKR
jgi:pilus assembly protein CpaE